MKSISKRILKTNNKREESETENDVFMFLETKKESAEDGKKRAIQISLTNWNKLVEIQLIAQETENIIRRDKLDGRINSLNSCSSNGGKDFKNTPGSLGGRNKNGRRGYHGGSGSDGEGGRARGGSGGGSVGGEERRRDRDRDRGRYYAHTTSRVTTAEYPPLL